MRQILFLFPIVLYGQVNILTANYGNERTNANLNETILNTSNVNPSSFGKLGAFTVDGQIYAQPLYVSGLNIADRGNHNVVFVATMHNTLYAFDADQPAAPDPFWMVNFGPSAPASVVSLHDIQHEVGILSTPVIDLSRNAIYLVTETMEKGGPVFRLHAIDLSSGQEKLNGPMEIAITISGSGDASQDGQIPLDPLQHLQRPALLLANDRIYIGFGSISDRYPYHGWIAAYDANDIRNQVAVFNVTPEGGSGGVWQSGRGLAADSYGNIYAASGNGDYDGLSNFGEAFIKLSPELTVMDWFAPQDWQSLSGDDDDIGSLGPVLVPKTNLMVGGDKANHLYLLDRNQLGHLGFEGEVNPQIFQAIAYGGIFNIALWNRAEGPLAYVVEEGDWTFAYRIVNGRFEVDPFSATTVASDVPFQGMAVSAKSDEAGSGILWITAGDHNQAAIPGTLYAYDALDLTHLLWTSESNFKRDRLGSFAKFVGPTVANGRVYVPTFSNQLMTYGLLANEDPKAGSHSHGGH